MEYEKKDSGKESQMITQVTLCMISNRVKLNFNFLISSASFNAFIFSLHLVLMYNYFLTNSLMLRKLFYKT